MSRPALAALVALLAGCPGPVPDTADAVVRLDICDPAGGEPCSLVADGSSEITLKVSTPSHDRPSDLKAAVSLSSGAWLLPDDPTHPGTVTASLATTGAWSGTFRTTNQPGWVRVDVTLGGWVATKYLKLDPVALTDVDVSAMPLSLKPETTGTQQLVISAKVLALSGTPSAGTRVKFEVLNGGTPAAFLDQSDGQLLDGTTASNTLVVFNPATRLTFQVTATPPAVAGTNSTPVVRTVTLNVEP